MTNKGGRIERFIFPVDAGNDGRPLGDITNITFKSALKGRVGLSTFIQEGCPMDRDFLDFTSPRPMGQGAREGTFLAGEIVQPSASLLSSWPLQALWIVATLWMFSNPALISAISTPFKFASSRSYRICASFFVL